MNNFAGIVIRFVASAIVLMVAAFFVPGFDGMTFFRALFAALIIAAVSWIIERFTGRDTSPFGRGITGFLTSAVVLYLVQWFIPGIRVTLFGALVAALIIGIVDLFLPGDVFRNRVADGRVAGNRIENRNDRD